jgi:hypothetical protein
MAHHGQVDEVLSEPSTAMQENEDDDYQEEETEEKNNHPVHGAPVRCNINRNPH